MSVFTPDQFADLLEDLFTKHRDQIMSACEDHKLSVTQMVTLVHLSKATESRMGELAEVLGITQGAVTPIIDKLVERGWVERFANPCDRRSVWVRLTATGTCQVDQLCQDRTAQFARLAALMQPDEVQALYQGLKSLLDAWRRLQP